MKKSTTLFLATIIMCLCLCGCDNSNGKQETSSTNQCFTKIYGDKTTLYYIVYDDNTKVMYSVSNGMHNGGNLTMLVNADGTPKLHDGK